MLFNIPSTDSPSESKVKTKKLLLSFCALVAVTPAPQVFGHWRCFFSMKVGSKDEATRMILNAVATHRLNRKKLLIDEACLALARKFDTDIANFASFGREEITYVERALWFEHRSHILLERAAREAANSTGMIQNDIELAKVDAQQAESDRRNGCLSWLGGFFAVRRSSKKADMLQLDLAEVRRIQEDKLVAANRCIDVACKFRECAAEISAQRLECYTKLIEAEMCRLREVKRDDTTSLMARVAVLKQDRDIPGLKEMKADAIRDIAFLNEVDKVFDLESIIVGCIRYVSGSGNGDSQSCCVAGDDSEIHGRYSQKEIDYGYDNLAAFSDQKLRLQGQRTPKNLLGQIDRAIKAIARQPVVSAEASGSDAPEPPKSAAPSSGKPGAARIGAAAKPKTPRQHPSTRQCNLRRAAADKAKADAIKVAAAAAAEPTPVDGGVV
jgi:hypothetical protein